MKSSLKRWKAYFDHYERWFMPLTLLVGVIMDYVAFQQIDVRWTFAWLGAHLALVPVYLAAWIWGIEQSREGSRRQTLVRVSVPLLLQISFGVLLSGSFIFYWFSGALSVSWPFLGLVAIIMVSNDVFRHYFTRPLVQLGVYAFACFSLSALMVPFAVNEISPEWFVIAGVCASVWSLIVLWVLAYTSSVWRSVRAKGIAVIATVFLVMNGLYFTQIIPPIPLSLREAQVAHEIIRQGNEYQLTIEPDVAWWNPIKTIHVVSGERVYIYTAIFAPADIKTEIVHVWQRFDESARVWKTVSAYEFPVVGGRQAGYRGYSFKANVEPGTWRVQAQTMRGQVLGRVRFNVEHTQMPPTTTKEKR